MAFRRIEVDCDLKHEKPLTAALKACKPIDIRSQADEAAGRLRLNVLVRQESGQAVVDAAHKALQSSADWRLFAIPVEATLPKVTDDVTRAAAKKSNEKQGEKSRSNVIREEVFEDVSSNGKLTPTYLVLTALSAVVAALGLNMDSVAVVIGAMVIAPLLGPQLALSFGIALGARDLALRSIMTAAAGTFLAVGLSVAIAQIIVVDTASQELVSRTTVNIEGIVLALASGAAAALSLLAGLSTTLVGVMVAVALLPPAAVCGLMLGIGLYEQAFGALMLLVANIICVNLSAQLVFLSRGVGPRSNLKKDLARRSGWYTVAVWTILLAVFVLVILPRIQGLSI
jgi:uncharacterized hydrophobic protein (TIGR00341 family)